MDLRLHGVGSLADCGRGGVSGEYQVRDLDSLHPSERRLAGAFCECCVEMDLPCRLSCSSAQSHQLDSKAIGNGSIGFDDGSKDHLYSLRGMCTMQCHALCSGSVALSAPSKAKTHISPSSPFP